MFDKKLYGAFAELSRKELWGRKFDEYFNVHGVPLRWFFHTIITSGTLPSLFVSQARMKDAQSLRFYEHVKFSLGSHLFRFFLQLNENFKQVVYSLQKKRDKQGGTQEKKKVLFLTFPHHLAGDSESAIFRIGGVVNALKEDGTAEPFVLVAQPFTSFSSKKLPSFAASPFWYADRGVRAQARTVAHSLSALWKKLSTTEKERIFTLNGHPFWPKLRYTLDFLFSKRFLYYLCFYYLVFDRVINRESISAVVVTSVSGFFEKCLFAAAKKNDVPVVCIQHGTADNFGSKDYFLGRTTLALFSDYYKKIWVDGGMNPNDVVVTGPVIFDGIEKYIKKRGQATFKRFLILTQPFVEEKILKRDMYLARLQQIIDQIRRCAPQAAIVLKIHPRESRKTYLRFVRENALDLITSQDRGLFYKTIHDSDVVIHFGTGAAFETMAVGTLTITVRLDKDSNFYFYSLVERNNAGPLCSYDELFDVLRKLGNIRLASFFRQNQQRFVRTFCYKIDGMSAMRVVKLIRKEPHVPR